MTDDLLSRLVIYAEQSLAVADREPNYILGLVAEVRRLRAEREEVEFQLHGGTDADGPVSRGLDGLDLPGKANVVHFTAVDALTEVYELRAAIREHDWRYTLDGGGRARCYPVMGELLPGDDDE